MCRAFQNMQHQCRKERLHVSMLPRTPDRSVTQLHNFSEVGCEEISTPEHYLSTPEHEIPITRF